MKILGLTAFEKVGDIDLCFVQEAEEAMNKGLSMAVVAGRRTRRVAPEERSAAWRFFHSGWWVAILCVVVSASVVTAMVRWGRMMPEDPPAGQFTETESETATDVAIPDEEEETSRTLWVMVKKTGKTYDLDGQELRATRTLYAYDAYGRLLSEELEGSSIIRYTYDDDGQCTSEKLEYVPGAVSTVDYEIINTYDEHGNLVREDQVYEDGRIKTTEYTYDVENRVLARTNESFVVSYVYDANGGYTQTTADRETGEVWSTVVCEYENGVPVRENGRTGHAVTTIVYEYEDGLLVRSLGEGYNEKEELTATTEYLYTYDEHGNCLTEYLYMDGRLQLSYEYEYKLITVGETSEETEIEGETLHLPVRRVTEVYTADTVTSSVVYEFVYDEFGQLLRQDKITPGSAEPFDVRLQYGYDVQGNETLYMQYDHGRENVTVSLRTYDEQGRVVRYETRTNDGTLTLTVFEYKAEGVRVGTTTDREGNVLSVQTIMSDAKGQPFFVRTESNGSVTEMESTYNQQGKVIRYVLRAASGAETVRTYAYNDQGDLVSEMADTDGERTYEAAYEYENGLLVKISETSPGASGYYVYTYDEHGNLLTETGYVGRARKVQETRYEYETVTVSRRPSHAPETLFADEEDVAWATEVVQALHETGFSLDILKVLAVFGGSANENDVKVLQGVIDVVRDGN